MGSLQYQLRSLWLPQYIALVVVIILVLGAINPGTALPVLVGDQAKIFLLPAGQQKLPPPIRALASTPVERTPKPKPTTTAQPTDQPPSLPPIDCSAQPCIALSFDDGPDAIVTPQVLTILEQEKVTASFFLVGKNIAGNEPLVQRMVADDFEIGNHTWNHPDLTKLTGQQVKDELTATQLAIINAGAPAPTLFRPPYGAVNATVLANSIGLQAALWNEDPRDWQATSAPQLQASLLASAKPGGVVDLHDTHAVTPAALPGVIDQLRAENFQFVTVTQLMHSRVRPGNDPFYGYQASMFPNAH